MLLRSVSVGLSRNAISLFSGPPEYFFHFLPPKTAFQHHISCIISSEIEEKEAINVKNRRVGKDVAEALVYKRLGKAFRFMLPEEYRMSLKSKLALIRGKPPRTG